LADGHITVTNALSSFLVNDWDIPIKPVVLYDRPPAHFRRLTDPERKEFLKTLPKKIPGLKSISGKRVLVVTGTSWTPDEDIQILIDSIEEYHKCQLNAPSDNLPSITVVITGKGPLKDYYLEKIDQIEIGDNQILTAWLPIEDYPLLLGSADIGVSLHYSSSGLDLPMKVIDMFGCGLPVLSIDYSCITELIKPNVTGLLFQSSTELTACLKTILKNFPENSSTLLEDMRKNVKSEFDQNNRWTDLWNENILPIVTTTD
jgi:beta-1,4-mannosyltransferase